MLRKNIFIKIVAGKRLAVKFDKKLILLTRNIGKTSLISSCAVPTFDANFGSFNLQMVNPRATFLLR
jgi:hypothetical protein